VNRSLMRQPTGDSTSSQQAIPAQAVIAAALWGTSYVAAKVVVQSLPPLTAAAFRFLAVAVLLWIATLVTGRWQPVKQGDWTWLALAGLLQTSIYFSLQYAGIQLTSASNTSVIVNVRPVFVAILSAILLHEALTMRKAAGILVAFAGIVILTTKGSLATISLNASHVKGDFLILLNAISGALGIVVNKRVLGHYRPFPAMVYTQTFGALGLFPLAVLEIARGRSFLTASPMPWLLLLYQALFSTIVAHLLWNRALARMEASRAAVFIYIAPLVTSVLSHVLLGETIGLYLLLGALLVFSGAVLTMSGTGSAEKNRQTGGSWK
jgi:drug/metabolite transporter (DMT)-like permease